MAKKKQATKKQKGCLRRIAEICGMIIFVFCGLVFIAALGNEAGGDTSDTPAPNEADNNVESTSLPSPTATNTPLPSATFTDAPTATITNTLLPTDTAIPTQTAVPATEEGNYSIRLHWDTTYYTLIQANARSCPHLNDTCPVMAEIPQGTAVISNGATWGGDEYQGTTYWHRVRYQDRDLFIHSALLSQDSPSSEQMQSQTLLTPLSRPANCDEAVAWGYTAEQAAQWDHLDRDGDGVACYGD